MSEVIKFGNLLKYSDNAFNSKWKSNYVELCQNSTFRWCERKGDQFKKSINLKDVSAFLAFGEIVKQLPFKPDLKPEQMDLVIAIPHENNRNTRLSFFLCSNESEIKDWVNSILNLVSDSLPEKATSYPVTNNPPNSGSNFGNNFPPSQMSSGPAYGNPPLNPGNMPYQGPPPSYFAGSSQPPPIGFNIGNPQTSMNPPVYPPNSYAPMNYSNTAYPAPYQPPGSYPVTSGMTCSSGPPTGYQPGVAPPSNYPRQTYIPGPPQQAYIPGVPVQPTQNYVIVDGKKKKKHSKLKKAAIGVAAGAATAYAAKKMFGGWGGHGWGGHGWGGHGWGGHGWGGHGWGGHYGSWSSLSSGSWSD